MQHTTSILFSVMALAGCANSVLGLPITPEDMRASQSSVIQVCTQLEPAEAADRVRAGWRGCHYTGPTGPGEQAIMAGTVPIVAPTSSRPGDYIKVVHAGSRTSVLKGPITYGFSNPPTIQLLADIEPTATCKALVTARGANFAWQKAAAEIRDYLENPDQACKR